MRFRAPLILAVVILSLLAVPLAVADTDGAEEPGPFYVEGYVAEGGGSGKIPLDNVFVVIMGPGSNTYEGTTDLEGYFKIKVNENTGLQIKFTKFGYSLIGCPNITPQQGSDFYALDLSTALYNATTKTYSITSPISGMQCAIMSTTEGVVRGTVSFPNGPVNGATIHLDPVGGDPGVSTVADSKGHFEITCPIGAYNIWASNTGFVDSDVTLINVTSNPSTINIVLTKSQVSEHLGLDMAHILMLIGVCLGIVFATVAWLLSRRMNGPNRVAIIDDNDFDDDEDLR
jgi:hypothetical protein